jgi:hypothetical protein
MACSKGKPTEKVEKGKKGKAPMPFGKKPKK